LTGGNKLWSPTNSNILDVQNGPMANAGQQLIKVYTDYQHWVQDGSHGTFATATENSQKGIVQFSGNSVGVDVVTGGNVTPLYATLQKPGMKIPAGDGSKGLIEGYLPITQLLNIATQPLTLAVHPLFVPKVNFQGIANNQAEVALQANTARSTFNVN